MNDILSSNATITYSISIKCNAKRMIKQLLMDLLQPRCVLLLLFFSLGQSHRSQTVCFISNFVTFLHIYVVYGVFISCMNESEKKNKSIYVSIPYGLVQCKCFNATITTTAMFGLKICNKLTIHHTHTRTQFPPIIRRFSRKIS